MGGSVRPRLAATSSSPRLHLVAALLILALSAERPPAQERAAAQQPVFSSGVTQVEVYATVTDESGRAMKGLRQEDFAVLEDEAPQQVTTFAGGDIPAAVALAIDHSFSMKGTPLTVARTAGRSFVASLLPTDRVMVIGISGEVEVVTPFGAPREDALRGLEQLQPWSTTSLHDAVIRSLDLLEGESGRRAIVLLSDGVDRYSTARAADVLDRARRSDVMLYPIAIGRDRPGLFAELAAVSGGRSFHLRDPKDLQSTLQSIVADLRAQYLIGYASTQPVRPGESDWRSITVKVNRPGARVRARSGYSAR